jgi:hypothetical protein
LAGFDWPTANMFPYPKGSDALGPGRGRRRTSLVPNTTDVVDMFTAVGKAIAPAAATGLKLSGIKPVVRGVNSEEFQELWLRINTLERDFRQKLDRLEREIRQLKIRLYALLVLTSLGTGRVHPGRRPAYLALASLARASRQSAVIPGFCAISFPKAWPQNPEEARFKAS